MQSDARIDYAEPTNEARAEAKLAWTMPCKEEEDEVNRDGGKNEVLSLKSEVYSLKKSLKSKKRSLNT